jgi:hypothetical protein
LKIFPQDLMFAPSAPAREGPSADDGQDWVPV